MGFIHCRRPGSEGIKSTDCVPRVDYPRYSHRAPRAVTACHALAFRDTAPAAAPSPTEGVARKFFPGPSPLPFLPAQGAGGGGARGEGSSAAQPPVFRLQRLVTGARQTTLSDIWYWLATRSRSLDLKAGFRVECAHKSSNCMPNALPAMSAHFFQLRTQGRRKEPGHQSVFPPIARFWILPVSLLQCPTPSTIWLWMGGLGVELEQAKKIDGGKTWFIKRVKFSVP